MSWSHEHYLKERGCNSFAWDNWPWEARALWPLLLREFDSAGSIEIDGSNPAAAVALLTNMPIEVVRVGLEALIEDQTIDVHRGTLCSVSCLEEQHLEEQRKASTRRSP
jgi:hypothetical protein